MWRSEEATTKSEAKSDRAFRLKERKIIELKFGHGRLEVLEIRGIDWVDAAKDHGMDFLKARQRIGCGSSRIGQSVADLDISGTLDIGDEVSDVPSIRRGCGTIFGVKTPTSLIS